MVLLESTYTKLKKGDLAPDFKLKATDGKTYSLDDFKAKALLIIFMCNHCPYVKPKFKDFIALQNKFKDDLIVIGINANDAENYPEDSFEKMQEYYENEGFNFYYIQDETQEVAQAYGAVCTPDPFLFDKDRKLVYHGRINNAHGPDQEPTTKDMEDAITAVLEGKEPSKEQPSMGCSIKWKETLA